MAKWIIESNIGYGWEQVHWAGSFKEEEDAWDFIYGDGEDGRWDGQVRAVQEDDDEYDDLDDIGRDDDDEF
jgi:hypothetical protein